MNDQQSVGLEVRREVAVSDQFAWVVAASPLWVLAAMIGFQVEANNFGAVVGIGWAVLAVSVADVLTLRKAGFRKPAIWWVLITPLYLAVRARALNTDFRLLWVYIGATLCALVIEQKL